MPRSPSRSRSPPPRRRERSRSRDKERYRDRERRSERPRDRPRDRDSRHSRRPDSPHRSSRRSSRDRSRDRRRPRHHSSSKSPSHSPPPRRNREPLPSQDTLRNRAAPPTAHSSRPLRREDADPVADTPPVEKQKPNFSQTGLLAAATNTLNNTVLKYSEPSEARLPSAKPEYKLFVFKDAKIIDTINLNPRSCWLIGRDRAVADLPVDHPSCSKQHAVLQWRFVTKTGEFGDRQSAVRLYLLDLESANGTRLGKVRIEGRRYVELKEGDLVTFGESTREYVVMVDRG